MVRDIYLFRMSRVCTVFPLLVIKALINTVMGPHVNKIAISEMLSELLLLQDASHCVQIPLSGFIRFCKVTSSYIQERN